MIWGEKLEGCISCVEIGSPHTFAVIIQLNLNPEEARLVIVRIEHNAASHVGCWTSKEILKFFA